MAQLYELKEKLATLYAQRNEDANWIAEKAANPETPMDEINAKTAHRNEIQSRIDLLEKEHDDLEAKQKAAVKKQAEKSSQLEGDPKKKAMEARGEFYRAALTGGDVRKAYESLGAIPASDGDLGYGDKLLPTNMTSELITEPLVENPMRTVSRVSNITGLEEPKLLFDIDGADYDDITDKETANEIEIKGDTVTYGRHKVKVRARISDTVMHGSNLALASEVENALRSGLAANEMARMFKETPITAYEGMSFYSTANGVASVTGTSIQDGIAKALANLPITYRRNAKIIMNAVDWYNMWPTNLNQSGMFYEDRPLSLYGKQVVLVDDAVYPVVGDFSYSRINYDIGTTYDTDKDVDAGVYKFVLTAWYDIKLRLSSAFRIVKVNP